MEWKKEKSLHLAKTYSDLEAIAALLDRADVLAVDTETTGLHRFANAVGISLAWSEDEACYIPLKTWDKDSQTLQNYWNSEQETELGEFLRELLSNKKLLMHNAVFDCKILDNDLGVNFIDRVTCDTMLLAHTVYREDGGLGLKKLASELLDKDADSPQLEVKESVKANGGSITKDNFEMFKCNFEILSTYACYDVMYTFGLYNRLYPEIEKQDLTELWNREVMALLPVTYELNTNGIRIDVPYFEQLKLDMIRTIRDLENDIYFKIRDRVYPLEVAAIKEDMVITHRSELGKYLASIGKAVIKGEGKNKTLEIIENCDSEIYDFYCNKNSIPRYFNFNSSDHKAVLLFDVLGYEITKTTDTGKPCVDHDTIEGFYNLHKEEILKKLLDYTSEKKLLSTYVNSILESHVNGRIYTGFNQTGTSSGRYSSSEPINLQTLPRDDKRIKKGFIPDEGEVFVGDDYESLEPRIFAHESDEPNIRKVYEQGLDLYSQVGIDVYQLTGVSAKETDSNFLKKVNPEIRQRLKVGTLARPYGGTPWRLAEAMGISLEEAKEFCERYDKAYPNLTKWARVTDFEVMAKGYVRNIVGRKRRANLTHTIYRKYGKWDKFNKRDLASLLYREGEVEGYTEAKELYSACKHNFDNGRNFKIQSTAASVINASLIEFKKRLKQEGLTAKILLCVHDENIVSCPREQSKRVAQILKESMEHNWVTEKLSVKMKAEPVITDKSLAEAK